MASIKERVYRVVAGELNVDESSFTDDTSLIDNLRVDSLDLMELTLALEEEFDMEIPDEEAKKLNTVGQVVGYVEKNSDRIGTGEGIVGSLT